MQNNNKNLEEEILSLNHAIVSKDGSYSKSVSEIENLNYKLQTLDKNLREAELLNTAILDKNNETINILKDENDQLQKQLEEKIVSIGDLQEAYEKQEQYLLKINREKEEISRELNVLMQSFRVKNKC